MKHGDGTGFLVWSLACRSFQAIAMTKTDRRGCAGLQTKKGILFHYLLSLTSTDFSTPPDQTFAFPPVEDISKAEPLQGVCCIRIAHYFWSPILPKSPKLHPLPNAQYPAATMQWGPSLKDPTVWHSDKGAPPHCTQCSCICEPLMMARDCRRERSSCGAAIKQDGTQKHRMKQHAEERKLSSPPSAIHGHVRSFGSLLPCLRAAQRFLAPAMASSHHMPWDADVVC